MSGSTTTGTLTVFTPTPAGPFTFGATLDGQAYVCSVTWNLWAQRWYLNVSTTTGTLICAKALITSTDDHPINLVFGYFQTSVMVFYDDSQTFVVTP